MAVVPQQHRVAAMRRAGLSDAIVRLASGDCVHPVLRANSLGPSFYVDHGAVAPGPGEFLPLWDDGDTMVGVLATDAGSVFVEQDIETPGTMRVVARSEAGFWVSRFDALYELDEPDDVLRDAASAVGFPFIKEYFVARGAVEGRLSTSEAHRAFLAQLTQAIDARFASDR